MMTPTTPTDSGEPIDGEPPPPVVTDAAPKMKILKKPPAAASSPANGGDDGDDAPPPPAPEERRSVKAELSKELLQLKQADHLAVKEWLTQLAAQASIQIHVHRREPKVFTDPRTGQEKKCDGLVGKYETTIDEQEIQKRHGGGTYQLIVKVRNAKGNWEYFNARTIELAGDPRLDDVPRAFVPPQQPQAQQGPDPMTRDLMGKAFDFMANQANRPTPMQGTSTADIMAAVQAAIAPFQATIDALHAQLAARDREIAAIREQATKGDPYKDKLLDKMIDGDSARISALRTQHESELRMVKEQAIANENRIRDQHQRDIDRMERAHERELASMKTSAETERRALETTQSTQKMVLDNEIKRLEKEIGAQGTELIALRAKKDQSVGDKIKEMKDLKELLGDDDDDDDDDKSTITRVIEAAGNLPIVAALADRVSGGGAQQAAQQQAAATAAAEAQQQQPQRRRLVRDKRTGQVMAPNNQGQLVPLQRVVPSADGNSQVAIPSVDPATVKMALDYMTSAFQSGTTPEDFAESARPMIPQSVLGAMRALGIDEFMSKVAQLDGTSPLATQSGRNWRRKVAAKLLGETDE